MGGAALGIKYLCDEVPPGVAWSDPANRLFLGTGPLEIQGLRGRDRKDVSSCVIINLSLQCIARINYKR